jgi:hypothetical protein
MTGRFAEKSEVARRESVHAATSIFFGVVPIEVRITPLAGMVATRRELELPLPDEGS